LARRNAARPAGSRIQPLYHWRPAGRTPPAKVRPPGWPSPVPRLNKAAARAGVGVMARPRSFFCNAICFEAIFCAANAEDAPGAITGEEVIVEVIAGYPVRAARLGDQNVQGLVGHENIRSQHV